jgi:[ribosomal protein S5]-alanine N-acetyltransferase
MKIILQTQRLILREHNLDDATDFFHLNDDEKVLLYTGDNKFKDKYDATNVLMKIVMLQHQLYNLGRWAVIRKSDNKYIGWCGFKYDDETKEVNLGYRFFSSEWGKGYATEAAQASMNIKHVLKDVKYIVGRVHEGNDASAAVLKKCDFVFQYSIKENNSRIDIYHCIL